jgi:hypothetical protein
MLEKKQSDSKASNDDEGIKKPEVVSLVGSTIHPTAVVPFWAKNSTSCLELLVVLWHPLRLKQRLRWRWMQCCLCDASSTSISI